MCRPRMASRLRGAAEVIGTAASACTFAHASPAGSNIRGPNITAFQSNMLSAHGAPLTPEGGSRDNALKSRTRRRRAVFDYCWY